jgi:hypothetical protein
MMRLLCVSLVGAMMGFGASTASWEMSNYQDFSRGKFQGVSLTRDGRILLAPSLETVFASDQPSIWSVAQTPDGTLYLGTGHRGRVFRVDGPGKSTLLWTAPQPEIFALAVGPDGAVYAGTSPDGKIYRIQNGNATEYFSPGAKYIWALAFGKDGALYAGTGDLGKVFRVTAPGVGELYYETGQSNVTCLSIDVEGRLLAGSEPNGLLYRITAKDKAFVLYDANLPEIRAITSDPSGAVYIAALGGSLSQRLGAAAAGSTGTGITQVTAPSTSITVTDEAADSALDVKTKAEGQKAQPAAPPTVASPIVEMAGVEKSALYKINPDNTVETIWSSKEENAYDLMISGDQIFFSTDGQGRIYRLSADRHVTLLVQTNEGETTRLLSSGGSLIAATGTMGKILRLSTASGGSGYFESPVHDASTVARWGQVSWRAQKDAKSGLVFRTRSGNSARPDKTWSDWSEPLSSPNGSSITSPNARFVQWKAELAGTSGSSPVLTGVNLSYLPQNTPPAVKSLNVTTQVGASAAGAKSTVQPVASSGTYSITVTDTGEAGASSLSGTPTQTISRGLTQQIQISWQAEDPDGDRLLYTLYFRGEDERQWKLLRSNFGDTSMLLDGEVFADGKYLFRIVASDKMSNAAGAAREAELISAPVLFDNTPPAVTAAAPRRNGTAVEVNVEARDKVSALRRAEYSLDAAAWVPIDPVDGVLDGLQEQFRLRVENLAVGEHLIVIRVFDSANNVGLTKVIVQ